MPQDGSVGRARVVVKQLRFAVVHIPYAVVLEPGDVQRETDRQRERKWGATLVIQLRERERAGARVRQVATRGGMGRRWLSGAPARLRAGLFPDRKLQQMDMKLSC